MISVDGDRLTSFHCLQGISLLMLMSAYGDETMVTKLVELGANVNVAVSSAWPCSFPSCMQELSIISFYFFLILFFVVISMQNKSFMKSVSLTNTILGYSWTWLRCYQLRHHFRARNWTFDENHFWSLLKVPFKTDLLVKTV